MKRGLRLVAFMGAAMGAGLLLGKLTGGRMRHTPLPVAKPVLFLIFGLVIFLVLLAHEVGHLAGGVC